MDAAGDAVLPRHDVVQVAVGAHQLPALIVSGPDVLQTAEQLRNAAPSTGQYPVIIGEFGRAAEYLESVRFELTPQQILDASKTVGLEPASWARPYEASKDANPKLRELLHGGALYAAAERQRVLAATPIPDVRLPPGEFIGHRNLSTGKPFLRVLVVLIPTADGWQAPAYLGFGGSRGCPRPEQHTQLLRHWHDTYGAKVVTIGANMLELAVERPPLEQVAALELARVQYDYCPEVAASRGATLGGMAAAVMQLRVWYFRWE